MRILVTFILSLFIAQSNAQNFTINDSLEWHLSTQKATVFVSKFDSANRLLINKELSVKLKARTASILYRDGVCYMIHEDSAILFYVDLTKKTKNQLKLEGKKIKSGMSEKKFRRKFKSIKNTKIVLERTKGKIEHAYTLFTNEESGIAYRVLFHDGSIVGLLMYHP